MIVARTISGIEGVRAAIEIRRRARGEVSLQVFRLAYPCHQRGCSYYRDSAVSIQLRELASV